MQIAAVYQVTYRESECLCEFPSTINGQVRTGQPISSSPISARCVAGKGWGGTDLGWLNGQVTMHCSSENSTQQWCPVAPHCAGAMRTLNSLSAAEMSRYVRTVSYRL
jgi:hypothetical protein